MTSQHLLSLADRVEGLSGPDREVDRAILVALGYTWRGMAYWHRDDSHTWAGSTHFTASIDAAMSLVPESMRDEIEITTLYLVARVTINMNHGPDGCPFYGSNDSNSIPLALCAASLRAIAGGKE